MMSEGLNPAQLTALCIIFVVFHLIAVPPFVWAMRRGQFRGAEQAEWTLDDPESPLAVPVTMPLNCPARSLDAGRTDHAGRAYAFLHHPNPGFCDVCSGTPHRREMPILREIA